MTRTSPCPSLQDLQRLLLGQLPEPEAERSEQHLRECSTCLRLVRQLMEQDTLIDALRTGAKNLQPDADTGVLADSLRHRLRELRPTTGGSGEASLAVPEQIGRYRILARLGAGGMGTVYKAEDPDLRRIVALKVPHFGGSEQQRELARQRFLREARAAAAIRHPHVCPIHDVGEYQGTPYVVMGFVEGQSLADRLAGKQRIEDPREAITLACQLAAALEEVHRHDIVHRDLKPANVLLEPDGRAVLTDFGLARPSDDPEHLTATGTLVGTPAFMAPEQVSQGGNGVGPWTDQYSLGVLLYRMLTGRLPFEGPTLSVIHDIGHETPPPPSRFRPELDAGLEKVILKAMARRREDRYESIGAFARALQTRLDAPGETVPTRSVRRRVQPFVAVGIALVVLVVGGLVARQFLSPVVPPAPSISSAKEPTRDPLSDLQASDIPEQERFEGQPKELVAVLGSHRWRHWGTVKVVAVSPDGKRVASSGTDFCVRLWDAATGKELAAWRGHAAAFHPDGRLAVKDDKAVRLLDAATLTERASFDLPDKIPHPSYQIGSRITFSLDGKTIAALTYSMYRIRVWDVATGKERLGLDNVKFPFRGGELADASDSVALSPDGEILAVSGQTGGVKLWDVTARKERTGLPPDWGWALAFSRDGQTLATGGADWTVRLWDVVNGKERARLTGHGSKIFCMAFSPDDNTLASASADRTVRLWDVAKGQTLATLVEHRGPVCAVDFARDGRTLLSGGYDAAVRLWDVPGGKQINELKGYPNQANLLSITPDGRALAVAGVGYGVGNVMHGDLAAGKEPSVWVADEGLQGISLSADGKLLATAGYKGLQLWDTSSRQKRPPFINSVGRTMAVAFDPKGARLAAVYWREEGGKEMEEVRVWVLAADSPTFEAQLPVGPYSSYPGKLVFSPDGTRIALAQSSKAIWQWKRERNGWTEQFKRLLPVAASSLSFSPDGETLVTATPGGGGSVTLWNAVDGEGQQNYSKGHEGDGLTCAVMADDGLVYSAGYDGRILRWTSPRKKEQLCQVPGPVYQLALTRDSRHLFTANSNGTVYILRLAPSGRDGQ